MTPPHPTENEAEDPVEALVFETLERLEKEGSAAIESAASDHPELEQELRSRLSALQAMGLLEAPVEPPLAIPARVGPFTLGRRLGEGGMGLVYEAHEPSIHRTIAIKLIRPQYLARISLRERFAREGQAIARLQHPAVARVFQVGEEEGIPFLAMERVFGCTVASVLDAIHAEGKIESTADLSGADFQRIVRQLSDGPDLADDSELYDGSWSEVVGRIAREVAEGLDHAHSAGVLHRDVKASNIMVTPGGRVLLIDFGLAQLDTAATLTATGSRVGSLPYTAPERFLANAPPTALADVYSLGVVLYEMLHLRLPFRASSEAGLIRLIAKGDAKTLDPVQGGVRAALLEVTRRAMRGDPERRPPDAAALAFDLSRALAGQAPIAHGDRVWAVLRSSWRAHPWTSAAVIAVLLLSVSLPTVVLSLRARAAEKVADSAQVSLRRLELALEATSSLRQVLPDSPILHGTPLESLRNQVLHDLAGIEARIQAEQEGSSGFDGSIPSGSSPFEAPASDRTRIEEARKVLAQGFEGLQDQAEAQRAVALVTELRSIRNQTSRSIDVDAALLELIQSLAIHDRLQGHLESSQAWRTQALELASELRRSFPESTWLEAREQQWSTLGESSHHE